MESLPLLLSSLSLTAPFYEPPFSYVGHPVHLALANAADQMQQLLRSVQQTVGPISTIGKDGFKACMNVKQFKPSELNVKVVDNYVVVEGKHEEREDDHGYVSRHFVRRYALPEGYDPDKVVSTLSSDGFLTVSVPKPQIEGKSDGRQIQIQQVGPALSNVKENAKDEKGGDGDKAKTP